MAKYRILLLLCMITESVFAGGFKVKDAFSQPMNFKLFRECGGSGCRAFVYACGYITERTPEEFKAYMAKVGFKPAIYFNSPGGNLVGGMELGRHIRALGLDTYIGGTYVGQRESIPKDSDKDDTSTIELEGAICYSACSYAFMGGVTRMVGSDEGLGMHQFSSKGSLGKEADAQVVMTALSIYLDDMEIDRKVLDIASTTSSNEITPIPISLAQTLSVDNTEPPPGKWELEASDSGYLIAKIAQKIPGKNAEFRLYLSLDGEDVVGAANYLIKQTFYSSARLDSIFIDNPEFFFEAGLGKKSQYVPSKTVEPWKRNRDGTYSSRFVMKKAHLVYLADADNIQVNTLIPNVYRSVAPDVNLPNTGLKKILVALERK